MVGGNVSGESKKNSQLDDERKRITMKNKNEKKNVFAKTLIYLFARVKIFLKK